MKALEHLKTPYYREYRTLIREKMCTTEPPGILANLSEHHPPKIHINFGNTLRKEIQISLSLDRVFFEVCFKSALS